MHQVEIARHAVLAGVHGHGRNHDAVLEPHAARLVGREHGHGRTLAGRGRRAGALGDPALEAFQPGRIAQPQVLVRNTLRAGQQRVGELLRLQAGVALDVLEPFGGVAGGVLDLQHFHAAHFLVVLQAVFHAAFGAAQAARQLDGILQRQLGARADGEVGGVGGVAHQHHRHARSPRAVSSVFQCTQVLQMTRGKRIQMAEPRKCEALLTSGLPSSQGANSFSQ